MMMNSAMAQDMRVLSDAEIAMVAGGDPPPVNEGGVDHLVNRDTTLYRTLDGAFVDFSLSTPMGTFQATALTSITTGCSHYIFRGRKRLDLHARWGSMEYLQFTRTTHQLL